MQFELSVRLEYCYHMFLCVCIFLVVQMCSVFDPLCLRVGFQCCFDVSACVICFNEVVCKSGFTDSV